MQDQFFQKLKDGNVLCFGELLLRLCPDVESQWLQKNQLPFYVGGAEANVASALALWQVPTSYLSRVPDNLIGRQLTKHLADKELNVSKMLSGGERLGLYFLPKGTDLKHAEVIYDRAHSSFSELKPGMIDWDKTLEDVSWLHFSAITPALNQQLADVCIEAASMAAQKGLVVSLDLNYRAKLWQYGKNPTDVMQQIAPYCDVLMGNIWAAEQLLACQINSEKLNCNTKEDFIEQAQETSKEMVHRFPNVKLVANTFRFDQSFGSLQYYATLFDQTSFCVSAEYSVEKIIDKVGSGDCFMAGLIYGVLKKFSLQQTLDFATAAAVKKLEQTGDATTSTTAEIKKFIKIYER